MPVTAFVVGAILPDVVDKGLLLFGILPCTRSFAHNVFFALGAGAIAFVATRRRDVAFAILLGCLLHLAQDSTHFVPYFYPLLQYDFNKCDTHLVFQPGDFEIAMEFVGAALIVIWWKWKAKLIYLRERILKTRKLKRVSR